MQERISSEHFTELIAYERINPQGEWRADLRAARICAVLVNCHRDHKRSTPPKIADFMPRFERQKEQTPDQMMAWAKALAGHKDTEGGE